MKSESAGGGGGKLLAAYRDYNRDVLSRGLLVANAIALVAMPSGVVLDYFVYPDWMFSFLGIRLAVVVLLAGIIVLLVAGNVRRGLGTVKTLGVGSALIINFSFCLMIFLTNGADSPYVSALNLIIIGMSILLPWTIVETGLMCVASLFAYAAACVANPTFADPATLPIFAYNCFFIVITTVVCVSITYFLSRSRFQEFGLRHQLDAQNRELQDLDRLKTRFFSNVSHELRTPLTLILGPVETLLARGDALDAKVHEGLILIHRSTLRLLKLINDLLDLTRLDQGAQVLRKSTMSIEPFVKGMVESVRHLGLAKRLRFKVSGGSADAEMTADPSRIEKVFINLLTNAIKYTPAGGTITVGWRVEAEECVIEVSDTGVGIPEEDLPKIFDRFHQVRSNAANQNQGVGIGLALARELVVQHGGTLEVSSRVGEGTTFRIRLPGAAGVEGEAVDAAKERAPFLSPESVEEPFEKAFRAADRSWRTPVDSETEDPPVVGGDGPTVLVADDEDDMRQYVVSLLAEDYRIVQTRNGNNVIALADAHGPDLVLLDWMMPGKDGLTVCRELREGGGREDLKIMLLTARIDEQSKIEALRSGADDFLTKPFSSIEVKTRIANLLRAGRLQRDLRARNEELQTTLVKLRETEAMLIQSEKMNAIGTLSAGLLHEINNPLNYTLTAISLAGEFKDSLNDEMREIFSDVEEGMLRVRDVVTDLKDFAYPDTSGLALDFALAEAFAGARKILTNELRGIELDVDLPRELVVNGRKTQLTHVFMNLLGNAARAIHEAHGDTGGVISVRGRNEGDGVLIEVCDNGGGIPDDAMNRIFEPFFTTRPVGSGMGMGLSVCHTIISAHDGTIRAGNRPAGGAVFTITMPRSKQTVTL